MKRVQETGNVNTIITLGIIVLANIGRDLFCMGGTYDRSKYLQKH